MSKAKSKRQGEIRSKIEGVVGTVENLGTLRRQVADLSTQLGDHGVVVAIDRASKGRMMLPGVRYKYNHFFTHWAILAISKLADSNRDSTSVPNLLGQLRALRDQGEMKRDRWVERIAGIEHWRTVRETERQKVLDRLMAANGGPIWTPNGAGERAELLSETWNRVTGRTPGTDDGCDDMEDWILESSLQPLQHPDLQKVQGWRNRTVAHQDRRNTRAGDAGYDIFPIKPLIRAYWSVIRATHRVLLLAEGAGLHGVLPTPQFSVAGTLSGGILSPEQTATIDERRQTHSERWERLLQQAEERWYRELCELRRKQGDEG